MKPAHGFTLLELMVVVIVLGLLAAIAVPRIGVARERAYITAMKSDLRNLASFEGSYFFDSQVYSSDLALLRTRGFQTTQDITVTVNEATSAGWSATAAHGRTLVRCYLFVGGAAPVGSATAEGTVNCS